MKKSYFIILVTTLLMLLMSACNQSNNEVITTSSETNEPYDNICNDDDFLIEYDTEKLDFNSALELSYCLADAKCIGLKYKGQDKIVYSFSLNKVIDGGYMPDIFDVTLGVGRYCVDEEYTYTSNDISFVTDTSYILPLTKHISVFWDDDKYSLSADVIIKADENKEISEFSIQGRGVDSSLSSIKSVSDITGYISNNQIACNQSTEDIGVDYIESDVLSDVVSASDYILEVKIDDILYEANDRTTYTCSIVNNYKANSNNFSIVYAALPKESVTIGEKYVLLLNRCSDDSFVYVVSSRSSSIYSFDDEKVNEIKMLIEK